MKASTNLAAPVYSNSPIKAINAFLWLFLIFSVFNLFAEATNWRAGILLSKPTLMVWLLLFFITAIKPSLNNITRNLLIVAILSAWAGDVFLLFVEQNNGGELFFLLGLSSFLITHLAYSIAFHKLVAPPKRRLPIPIIVVLAAFWITFNTSFWPYMPAELRGPVLVYSLVIVIMVLMARRLYLSRSETPAAQWIWWGAVLFLISDTFIGLNKFGQEIIQIPYVRLWIMSTYLSGQLLMIYGASLLMKEK